MLEHTGTTYLPYTPRQVFDLAADVKKYPEFLPWFLSARILSREHNVLHVDLAVRLSGIPLFFTTRAVLDPPRHMRIFTVDFPFSIFEQQWSFAPEGTRHTRVQYSIAIDLRFGLSRLMTLMVDEKKIAREVVEHFQQRARRLYGSGEP